ncbi:LysR family transcriptional regulator [Pseudoroseomonas wenyumeiae]|uniref:LysR family transcriptional regulator n=1 Tax=Teichococcus wenyumeiae TaxID=2478470 RepID=A0A3A9JCQ5_9PROT|nr:LysR family transcriptional regulator [Pseudoroseomonas wenyumeiae]RKK03211.1 LysR family transcriptional regulator [Pseudoroseomonas wenyumeiae]RMI15567.1 LysR family transcriptional regulator [Pseudoroseomonas wenyumeiae]
MSVQPGKRRVASPALSDRDGHFPRRLNPVSVQFFVSAVEEGSIARAALRENIVPSAISKRLSDLETLLGVALLERGTQGVVPTPAGEAFLHHARLLLRSLERMRLEMAEYGEGVRGHIRVRASASALSAGLPAEIQSFSRAHRQVKIELEEYETPAIVQDIQEGRADVGIGPDIFQPESLLLIPWRQYALAAVVPNGHALARRRKLSYSTLLQYEQVEQGYSSALSQLLDYAAQQSGLAKRTRIRVRGFEAVCRMIGSGMGIGVVPSFVQESVGRIYGLRFIPLDEPWAHPKICIMLRDLDSLPSAARSFVDHLRRSGAATGHSSD